MCLSSTGNHTYSYIEIQAQNICGEHVHDQLSVLRQESNLHVRLCDASVCNAFTTKLRR